MIDWMQDFVKRFCMFKEIQTLKADKFHGSVTIHFSDGVPMNYELRLCRRVENSNLTKGG